MSTIAYTKKGKVILEAQERLRMKEKKREYNFKKNTKAHCNLAAVPHIFPQLDAPLKRPQRINERHFLMRITSFDVSSTRKEIC